MQSINLFACGVLFAGVAAWSAEKYSGPVPEKPDVLYLLHADNLLETEAGEAREETKKDTVTAVIAGAASPAKTPLAEPIFLMKADKIQAERLAAYRLEVKNGARQLTVSGKKRGPRPIFLNVTRLEERLYRVEVDEPLENGEYTISPEGGQQTFSFQVY